MYKASWFKAVGTNPFTTSLMFGCASNISTRNEQPIINTSAMINASIFRMPYRCKMRKRKVSKTVMIVPQIKGNPVKRCIPMAMPNTSARSQAAMANSARMYKQKFTNGGYTSRLACARSLRLTIPNRALRLCNKRAIKLLINKTQINL